jgi:glycyl-tRNA synthetase beta chain
MTDFLLELRSEEIPARMQEKARADLEKLFTAELAAAGLAATRIVTYATPRRLALVAYGLPEQTQAVREETKGPRASAPPQALEGFLRKTGLTRQQLEERDGVLFAIVDKPGRATADVLKAAIPAIIRAFPWPKSMRWGAASASTESPRWVRPLQGIVAILGDAVLVCEASGVVSGAATVGHRFHHPGYITIGGASDYVEKLRACHVIVDGTERRAIIAEGANAAARAAGLALVEDEGLLFENAGLTEWPVPLLGRFDEAFLDVPPEVIQLTARVNQKYFVCRDADGALANAFVCTANVDAADGGAKIVEGNRKVLAARLSDARFFYDTDLKTPLEIQAKKLEKIVFHEKLGTVADKVERVAKLARWLVEEGIVKPLPAKGGVGVGDAATGSSPTGETHPPTPSLGREGEVARLADMAEQAARLSKADLVTGMVGEFPELQGLMGGYYARAEGLDPQVADAIRDHYKPVGQGDEVPTAPVTVAVSLADKLDNIFAFFLIDERPTGSKDAFALRRAALGSIALTQHGNLPLPLFRAIAAWGEQITWECQIVFGTHGNYVLNQSAARERVEKALEAANKIQSREWVQVKPTHLELKPSDQDDEQIQKRLEIFSGLFMALDRGFSPSGIVDFFADRLKVQQKEAGVRHDLTDAVFALGGEDDLVRLLSRVKALQAFVGSEDGANLLAGYKRAANILKKEIPVAPAGPQQSNTLLGTPEAGAHVSASEEMPPVSPEMGPRLRGGDGEGASTPEAISLSYTPEKEEADLLAALASAESAADAAVEGERFEDAMAALATLRGPIDAFFDKVTVNDADPDKRHARLAMLARIRAACHRVADFSKIEG